MENPGTQFLKKRYPGLAKSPEVTQAAKRTEKLTGEPVLRDPDTRIQNYLNRFKQIIEREDPQKKARGITALKRILVDRYVVRVEDIPDSYWFAQLRVVRNRGESGDWHELPEEEVLKLKQEHLAQSKEDQQGSIEEWIDYLASDKSSYLPDYLKYWAFAGMLRLERYEKAEKKEQDDVIKPGRFPERPTGRQRSVKMFPEVNENGLKFIASAYKQLAEGKSIYWGYNQDIPQEVRQTFLDALAKRDFRAAYGWVQEYIPPITDEEMQITEGENCGWATFSKELGNTGQDVANTLSGKGTGWCIAGAETAQGNYLNKGAELHIYYTRDKNGAQTNPRVVIVSGGNRVLEVRGIEWEENIDDYMKESDVIGRKLKEIPGGEEFVPTDKDTKRLTVIDRKMSKGETLTGEELAFLYELDRPIKYFGYNKDPRIEELRNQRNPEEDMPVMFGCQPSQIARSPEELLPDTRAYVGSLFPGIFNQLPDNVEYIYTSFPEGRISTDEVIIGTKNRNELLQTMKSQGTNVGFYAQEMIESPDFMPTPNRLSGIQRLMKGEARSTAEKVNIVRLKVRDLGFTSYPTTTELFAKAEEFGLELCPAEVGPHYCLQYTDQPLHEWLFVGMEPLVVGSDPRVFTLEHSTYGLELNYGWAGSGDGWGLDDEFVFRFRKNS